MAREAGSGVPVAGGVVTTRLAAPLEKSELPAGEQFTGIRQTSTATVVAPPPKSIPEVKSGVDASVEKEARVVSNSKVSIPRPSVKTS
jgi:hypothetical protein